MKKLLIFVPVFLLCVLAAACGAEESAVPPVTVADIAAAPAAEEAMAPADVGELSISSGEPAPQAMEAPAGQPNDPMAAPMPAPSDTSAEAPLPAEEGAGE